MKFIEDDSYLECFRVSKDARNEFMEMNSGDSARALLEQYSLAKHGSLRDVRFLSQELTKFLFSVIDDHESKLFNMLVSAKRNREYVVLMTPGYRNVKSLANLIFENVLLHLNAKLSAMDLPVIAKIKLPRLADPFPNYASLSEEERNLVARTTDHILPGKSFYQYSGIHVIYGDDSYITGTSSDRARKDAMKKGAMSFISVYAIMLDRNIALSNPAAEEELNTFVVNGELNDIALSIYKQEGFVPVLRSLKLLLDDENYSSLENRIGEIPVGNLMKAYLAYVNNHSGVLPRYERSLLLIRSCLIDQNLFDENGVPDIFQDSAGKPGLAPGCKMPYTFEAVS